MRTTRYTHQFKRDYKREKSGWRGKKLDALLMTNIDFLLIDRELPRHHCDHALIGEWQDHRDCHLKPDLVLIYRKPNDLDLELVRLGSHSELGW